MHFPPLFGLSGVRIVDGDLTLTVNRFWIVNAVANGMLSNNITEEILLLNRALEVLRWGRKEWKDVSPVDRGVIFELTFVNGVRSLLVQAMQEV